MDLEMLLSTRRDNIELLRRTMLDIKTLPIIDFNSNLFLQLDRNLVLQFQVIIDELELDEDKKMEYHQLIEFYLRNIDNGIDLNNLLVIDNKTKLFCQMIRDVSIKYDEVFSEKKKEILEEIKKNEEEIEVINKINELFVKNEFVSIDEVMELVKALSLEHNDILEILKKILEKNLLIKKNNSFEMKEEVQEVVTDQIEKVKEEKNDIEEVIETELSPTEDTFDLQIEKRLSEIGVNLLIDDKDLELASCIKRLSNKYQELFLIVNSSLPEDFDYNHFYELQGLINKLMNDYNEYLNNKNDPEILECSSILEEDYQRCYLVYEELNKQLMVFSELLLKKDPFDNSDEFAKFLLNERKKNYNVVFTRRALKDLEEFFDLGSKDINLLFVKGLKDALLALEGKSVSELRIDRKSSKLNATSESIFEYRITESSNGGVYRIMFFYDSDCRIVHQILFKNSPVYVDKAIDETTKYIVQGKQSIQNKVNSELDNIRQKIANNEMDEYEKIMLAIYKKLFDEEKKLLSNSNTMDNGEDMSEGGAKK